jgi:hypothetical protein
MRSDSANQEGQQYIAAFLAPFLLTLAWPVVQEGLHAWLFGWPWGADDPVWLYRSLVTVWSWLAMSLYLAFFWPAASVLLMLAVYMFARHPPRDDEENDVEGPRVLLGYWVLLHLVFVVIGALRGPLVAEALQMDTERISLAAQEQMMLGGGIGASLITYSAVVWCAVRLHRRAPLRGLRRLTPAALTAVLVLAPIPDPLGVIVIGVLSVWSARQPKEVLSS